MTIIIMQLTSQQTMIDFKLSTLVKPYNIRLIMLRIQWLLSG